MKGLIYRELYLSRKTYIIGLLTFALFVFLGAMVRLSMLYGNLAVLCQDPNYYETLDLASFYGFGILAPVIIFTALCGDGGVILSDYKCHWCLFCYTLPISTQKQAFIKFFIKVAAILTAFLLSLLNMSILCGISGRTFSMDLFRLIVILMMLATIINSATTPLLLKMKSSNAVILVVIITIIAAFLVCVKMLQSWFAEFQTANGALWEQNEDAFLDALVQAMTNGVNHVAISSPLIMVIALALGFFFTIKQLQKRELM